MRPGRQFKMITKNSVGEPTYAASRRAMGNCFSALTNTFTALRVPIVVNDCRESNIADTEQRTNWYRAEASTSFFNFLPYRVAIVERMPVVNDNNRVVFECRRRQFTTTD